MIASHDCNSKQVWAHSLFSFIGNSFNVYTLYFLQVIAENLSEEEIKGLRQMFNNMDTDKSGSITYEELKTGLTRLGSKLSEQEIKQLMDAVRIISKLCHSFFFYEIIHWKWGIKSLVKYSTWLFLYALRKGFHLNSIRTPWPFWNLHDLECTECNNWITFLLSGWCWPERDYRLHWVHHCYYASA